MCALVRARDEERGVGRLVDALRAQREVGEIEIVVVDSGSRDGTISELRRRGIEPIQIRPSQFTFGRAINIAAAASRAPVCVVISAHALPPDDSWAARMAGALEDPRVACAFGERVGPDLHPLRESLLQDLAHAERHPFYGYSNSAGGFRRELWSRRPFNESLAASEDKEWAWHWLREGMLVRLDPALAVHHSHDQEGPLRTFRRMRGDVAAVRGFRDLDALPLHAVLEEWWRGPHAHRSSMRARIDPRRIALLAGKYAGLRARGA